MPRPCALCLLVLLACATSSLDRPGPAAGGARGVVGAAEADLELREILVAQGGAVDLSPKVRGLAGKRVRLRGWLVVFEDPGAGGFWLAPRPVFQDESGAGSGDLPPFSVRVIAPAAVVRALPADSAPLEVVGRLEHGRAPDEEGRMSLVRLVVEDPRDVALLASKGR